MRKKGLVCSLAVIAFLVTNGLAQDTRFHQYTRQYMNPANPAVPVAAGYFGGSGDEYLCAGAFLPDGTALLGGNAYGPAFEPAGTRISVIGTDRPAPDFTMPRSGRNNAIQPPNWTHTAGAGFIVRLAPGYSSVQQVVRFPWSAGTITDMTAAQDGSVYVAGIAGENFASLTDGRFVNEDGISDRGRVFLIRMRPDLQGILWGLLLADNTEQPPKIAELPDGRISLIGVHARYISPAGEILSSSPGSIHNSWAGVRSHHHHGYVAGAMNHTRTGYEPWRQPFLVFRDADNSNIAVFYKWNSRLVGMNWSRLVSDSEIRGAAFDIHGNPILYGWSDGGNSVLEWAPYDLKTSVYRAVEARTGRKTGLGFSTWGAGVGSFAHIIRLCFETGEPLAKSNFIGYLASRNAPSSTQIRTLAAAADNSVLLAGSSAFGLIETGSLKLNTLNHEADDYIGGTFVAVLNEAMTQIRFSSALPGAGKVPMVRYSRGRIGGIETSSARVGDKTMVMFVTGAEFNEKFAPRNNAQKDFGGGNIDGMYVILQMDTLPEGLTVPDSGKSALSASVTPTVGDGEALTGTFNVSRGMNRDHSLIILRDGAHKMWPAFYMAHPEGGAQVDAAGSGSYTLAASGDAVEMGDAPLNRQRILGGTPDGYQDVSVKITLTGANTARAEVTYGKHTAAVDGRISIRRSRPTGSGINFHGIFELKKGQLGLAADRSENDEIVYLEIWNPGRP